MKLDTPARAAAFMARTSFRACASFALIHLLANPAAAQSIAGASVSAGSATVAGIGSNNVVVTQTSDKAVVDWRAFSVDAGTSVTFRQPGAASIALNRITGSGTTRIDGSLVANGQVWLLNPNGVLIGAGGSVAAGGFLASTHAMSNADFMAGHYQLTSDGTGTAGVVNLGSIVAAEGGYAVLAGNQVGNAGLVQARLGTVALGAGKTMVLDVVGDKLLSFAVTEPLSVVASNGALVDNRGVLAAQGGQVLLTARAAAGVVGSVINTSGLIDATAVSSQGGTIVLDGGTAGEVDATGLLTVSGLAAGQTGGTIQAFGQTVVAGDYAALDARGSAGGGSIYLGGGWQGASIGGHASAVRAGVASTAVLDASATNSGNGGTVELWSDVTNPYSQTLAYGGFYARGGANGGDGGRIETSGHYLDTAGVTGSASAVLGKAGTWLFDPYNVEVVAAGSGGTTDLFANGLGGWQVTNYDSSKDTTSLVTAFAANGTTYTSPVAAGNQFVLLNATSDGSYNYALIYNGNLTSSASQTLTLYLNFVSGNPTSGTPQGYGYASNNQTGASINPVYSTSTNGWTAQTLALNAGNSYTLEAYSYSNTASGGFPQLAVAASLGGGVANGSFSNFGGTQTWIPTATASKIDVSQISSFLNAGTNVRITTTGAGTDVGNITVSSAIAKSAGAAATLQLDATNAIIVNQAISSSASALNVTLNAGAGGIQLNNAVNTNGGTLTLNTNGASTQTAAGTFTTGTLALGGVGGSHTLTNAGNSFATLAGSTGSANLADSVAVAINGLSATSTLTLASTGAISLGGTDIFGGATTLTSPGTITLVSGAQVAASGLLALEAGANFTNSAGANAISTTGSGRWLVYSQAPANDTFGGLVSGNTAVWGATVASTPPGSAPSGNRYLFALSPTITVTPTATHKTYGDTLTAAGVAYTTSGLINAATYGNVFTQDVLTGAPGVDTTYGGFAPTSYTGAYQLHSTQGTLATTSGYTFAFGQSTLTVDPKALLLTALTDSRIYDRTTTSSLTPTVSGLVNGDTISNLSQSFDSANAGNRLLTANTSYVISTTGGQTGSFNYTVTRASVAGTITPKALTAALTGSTTKTYDGTTTAALPSSDYQLSGVIQGDTVALNNPANGSYADRNVSTGKTVSVTGLALTGASAANYTVNANASAAIGAITAKALTLAAVTTTKVYDGNATSTAAATATGLVTGDTVSQLAEQFDSANAGNRTLSIASGYTVNDGNGGANYAVTLQTASGNITQKALTASLTGTVSKIYDGTTAATLAAGNYSLTGGIVANDQVALNNPVSGTYDTRNVGTGKTVSVTGLLLTGAAASNYTVNADASAAIGSITAKTLAASLIGSVAKTYDGTTAATLTDGNYALAGTVSGDAVALNNPTAGSYDTKNAGSGKTVSVSGLALTGADAGNYTVNTATSATVGSISAKTLAASLIGSVAKTYDGTTAATLTGGNYALAGTVSGDAVALNNPTAGTYDTKDVGSAKTVSVNGLALTGADAGNYTVNADTSAAVGSISAKTLAASLTGSVAKTYDGTTAATLANGNYVLTGAVSGDNVALNDPVAGTYDTKNAGSGKTVAVTGLALTGADAGNYTVNAGTSAAIGSVAAKALAASLTGTVSKTYDGTTAATLANGNYVLSGAVAGDAVALNDPAAGQFDTKNAGSGKTVSVTGLALTGGDAGNYTVNAGASAAIGVIAAKTLAASLVGSVAKTYDGTTAATLTDGNYALTGAVSGDAVALNDPVAGAYDTRNVGSGKTVAVSGLALTGADAGNYTVNAAASASIGNIAAKTLAATLTGTVAKTYDGTTSAMLSNGNYVLAGAVAGDSVALNDPAAGTYDTKNVGSGKTVAVSGLALTGTDAENYTVNAGTSAAIGSVAAKALAASLTGSVAKTYDGTTAAMLASGNYVLSGAVAGDAVGLNDPTVGAYDTKNAGSGKTVAVSGLALTGADAANYTVNAGASAAVGSVAAKALAASLTGGVSKTYDGTTAAALANGNYVLSGAVSGDAVALNSPTTGTYDTKNVGTGKTVAVAGLALTGADAANYTVNAGTSAAIGSIATKTLSASLSGSVSKTYDGTTTATLANGNYVLAGVVSGDAVALNDPVAGTYDTKNVGTAKTVAVAGLALTGADATNYTVNGGASAAVGTIVAKALTVALVGTVAKTANGGTDATLAPDNFLLAGFVSGEGATIGKTSGDYANAGAGTGIVVTTTLAASDFAPAAATALSNYVLPLGKVSGPVGTINPSIVIVTPQPAAPPAAVIAAIAATAVLPATSVPVPVTAAADAPGAAVVSAAAAVGSVAISVDRSPPSPVAAQKPPTPVDSADAGDPILASVSEPPSEKPASHATRQTSVTIPIAGGLLGQQQALPSRSNAVPGVDQAFSGGGGSF